MHLNQLHNQRGVYTIQSSQTMISILCTQDRMHCVKGEVCFNYSNVAIITGRLPDDIGDVDAGIEEEPPLCGHAVSVGEVASHTHVDGRAHGDNRHNMGNLGGRGEGEDAKLHNSIKVLPAFQEILNFVYMYTKE